MKRHKKKRKRDSRHRTRRDPRRVTMHQPRAAELSNLLRRAGIAHADLHVERLLHGGMTPDEIEWRMQAKDWRGLGMARHDPKWRGHLRTRSIKAKRPNTHRCDPHMTSRRAEIIRRAHTRHQHGLSYAGAAPHRRPSNRALGHLELYDFMQAPPEHLFAYYRGNAHVGDAITTWTGLVLGHIVHRGKERQPMGGRVVSIRVAGKNGWLYVGNCNLSSGTYCRLRKSKPLRS